MNAKDALKPNVFTRRHASEQTTISRVLVWLWIHLSPHETCQNTARKAVVHQSGGRAVLQ